MIDKYKNKLNQAWIQILVWLFSVEKTPFFTKITNEQLSGTQYSFENCLYIRKHLA